MLIDFFDTHGRDLPWRDPAASPWAVLVSEVMLQQTPVVRVLPVFDEWLRRWPRPADLAADSPAAAIRAWGRLGYPRRAMRLHAAATAMIDENGGACSEYRRGPAAIARHRRVHRSGCCRICFRRPNAGGGHQCAPGAVPGGSGPGRTPGAGHRRRPRGDDQPATGRTRQGGPVLRRGHGARRPGLFGALPRLWVLPARRPMPVAAGRLGSWCGKASGADLARHRSAGPRTNHGGLAGQPTTSPGGLLRRNVSRRRADQPLR